MYDTLSEGNVQHIFLILLVYSILYNSRYPVYEDWIWFGGLDTYCR